jgi:hypothetical protein
MAKDRKWIQKAIKHPGALREQAKKEGGIDPKTGSIKKSWLQKKAKEGGKVGRRARLAITLGKLRKKGTKKSYKR